MLQHGYRFLILVGLGSAGALVACGDDETNGSTGGGGDTTTTSTSSAPSSVSSVSSTTTSAGSGGGLNIQCVEGSNTNITGPDCDLLQQNCPPGTGCEPINNAATTGCIMGGLKTAGMACANTNECVGGTACVFGKCAPFCCPQNHEPCMGGFCNVNIDYGMSKFAYVCSFPDTCTLFAADQCAPNEDCHPMWPQGIATCVQPSSTPVAEGEACGFINDCGDMQTCGPDGKCRYACLLADFMNHAPGEGGCVGAQTCVMVANNTIPDVGICSE